MSTRKLSNISISHWESFLELVHCKYIRTKGDHEIWTRTDLRRPVVFQKAINPVPEPLVRNNLRTLGYSRKDFFAICDSKKAVIRNGNTFILEDVKPKQGKK